MDKTAAVLVAIGLSLLLIALLAVILRSEQPQTEPQPTPVQTSPNLTVDTTHINWGILLAGQTRASAVTFTNMGTANTQPLHLSHSETNVGTVVWNLEGIQLKPGQQAEATIILQTYHHAPLGDFAFTITVTG